MEGRGNATINDMIIDKVVPPRRGEDDSEQTRLARDCTDIENALQSAQASRETLNKYLSTINADQFDIPRLETTLEGYMALSQNRQEDS